MKVLVAYFSQTGPKRFWGDALREQNCLTQVERLKVFQDESTCLRR